MPKIQGMQHVFEEPCVMFYPLAEIPLAGPFGNDPAHPLHSVILV